MKDSIIEFSAAIQDAFDKQTATLIKLHLEQAPYWHIKEVLGLSTLGAARMRIHRLIRNQDFQKFMREWRAKH